MIKIFDIASQVVRSFVAYSDQYLAASGLKEAEYDTSDDNKN